MNPFRFRGGLSLVVCTTLVAAPVWAQGVTEAKQGKGGSVVKGAAGTEGSTGDKLEHCDAPMGAMAVVEPQNEILIALTRTNCRRRSVSFG